MYTDLTPPTSQSSPTCYFSYVPSPYHFSLETPAPSVPAYSPDVSSDPLNPLLAFREPLLESRLLGVAMDASKLLQLQTAAAHSRPSAQPLQQNNISPTNSNASDSSRSGSPGSISPSPATICCSRCRRSAVGFGGMVKFGTNLFYCNHCANMVGYGG